MTVDLETIHFADPAEVAAPTLASEAAAGAAGAAAAEVVPASSLAMLLTGHILRDGEVVLLILKPSFWFIVFQSMRFTAIVTLSFFLARILGDRYSLALFSQHVVLRELATFLIAGRVMYATMQWMGRMYVLTDHRVIRLAGVYTIDVADCALRRVARTEVGANVRERLTGCGSVAIVPKGGGGDEPLAIVWQTVADPEGVNQQVQAAIHRAQSGGL